MRGTRRGILVAALVSGLAAASAAPAMAQPAKSPTISINVASGVKLFGDVIVQWANKKLDTVKVTGKVSASTAGEVLGLFAQPFPYRKVPQPVPGQSKTLGASSTAVSYSFSAKPQIATKYSVRVYASKTAKAPLASSPAQTAYMVSSTIYTGFGNCNVGHNRPICHQTLKLYTQLPPSTYKTESAKHLYVYFGITLGPRLPLRFPKTMSLISASVSKPRRLKATEFEQTLKFSFRVNNDAYYPAFTYCTKDSEAKDGLNLPGHHGCGSRKVSTSVIYLG